MTLDDELRRALAREDAPPGFDARLMARMASAERMTASELTAPRRRESRRWIAAAAATVLIASGIGGYYQHRVRVTEAERVTRDVRIALEIASEKLATVQRHVRESSQREF
jgi:hypothetical protein